MALFLKLASTVLLMAAMVQSQIPGCDEVEQMKADIKKSFQGNSFHPGALRLGKTTKYNHMSYLKQFSTNLKLKKQTPVIVCACLGWTGIVTMGLKY